MPESRIYYRPSVPADLEHPLKEAAARAKMKPYDFISAALEKAAANGIPVADEHVTLSDLTRYFGINHDQVAERVDAHMGGCDHCKCLVRLMRAAAEELPAALDRWAKRGAS